MIDPIKTPNNNMNGANDSNIDKIIVENGELVVNFASLSTNNINMVTARVIAINASILPATELEVNDLIVIIKMVIPPAIRE